MWTRSGLEDGFVTEMLRCVKFPSWVSGNFISLSLDNMGQEREARAENRNPRTSLVSSFKVTLKMAFWLEVAFIFDHRLWTTARSISPRLSGMARPRYHGLPNLLSGEKPV